MMQQCLLEVVVRIPYQKRIKECKNSVKVAIAEPAVKQRIKALTLAEVEERARQASRRTSKQGENTDIAKLCAGLVAVEAKLDTLVTKLGDLARRVLSQPL